MSKQFFFLKLLLAAGLLFGISSCSQSEWKQKHNISFYHWKSSFNVDEETREITRELDCQKVYIHLFDVVNKNGSIEPVDEIMPIDTNILFSDSVKLVPTVFISNDVFINMPEENVYSLASSVNRLIEEIALYGIHTSNYSEIQIDCDWTASTKDIYFKFLSDLAECNQYSPKEITSTIRLHQVKDVAVMGVPPVKKGYLMCYATSDPRDGEKSNSILDIKLLKNYTQNLESYPINLDFALPLYSWGIVTNHNGKVKLVNGISKTDLENDGFKKMSGNKYLVLEDCFINGLYINKDFTIEVEEITPDLLRKAKVYLDEKVNHEYNIVYYHLSKGFLKRFTINDLN